jgi:hypothetical protein
MREVGSLYKKFKRMNKNSKKGNTEKCESQSTGGER